MDPPDLDDNNTIIIPLRGRGSNRHNYDAAHRRQNWPLVLQLQPSHVGQRISANRNVIFSQPERHIDTHLTRMFTYSWLCVYCVFTVSACFFKILKSKVNYAVLSLLIERGV
jgi:hypothetical protein